MYLSRRAQRLLDLIEWFSNTCQHIFPSQRALAGFLKCSIRTVKRALAELRGNLVEVRRRYRRSNVYRLIGNLSQMSLSFDAEEQTESATPKQFVPIVGPTVVTSNSELKPPVVQTASSSTGYQNPPREEAEPSPDVELKRLAGLPGPVSGGEQAFLREMARQVAPEVLRGGIALGTARKMVQRSDVRVPEALRNEPVRSLRYFAGAILEAATLPLSYLQHAEAFIRRHRRAS